MVSGVILFRTGKQAVHEALQPDGALFDDKRVLRYPGYFLVREKRKHDFGEFCCEVVAQLFELIEAESLLAPLVAIGAVIRGVGGDFDGAILFEQFFKFGRFRVFRAH